jgi:type VI secretion system secreted protein Hcp
MNRLSEYVRFGVSWSLIPVLAVVVGVCVWIPADEAEAGAIQIEEGIATLSDVFGASVMYVSIPALQIPGPPPHENHPDSFEILGTNWGDELPGVMRDVAAGGGTGGGGSGQTLAHDFHFLKRMDIASPLLMDACAQGERFQEVFLFLHLPSSPPGPGHHDYLRITLTDASCTSYALGGAANQFWPAEHVTFNFIEIEMIFNDGDDETRSRYNFQTGR